MSTDILKCKTAEADRQIHVPTSAQRSLASMSSLRIPSEAPRLNGSVPGPARAKPPWCARPQPRDPTPSFSALRTVPQDAAAAPQAVAGAAAAAPGPQGPDSLAEA